MRTALFVFVFVAAALVATLAGAACADPINGGVNRPVTPGSSGETPLQNIFNSQMTNPFVVAGVGNDQNTTALWYPLEPTSATVVIEIAGYSTTNVLGIYSAANNAQTVQIFNGAASTGTSVTLSFGGGFVSVNGGAPIAFNLSQGLGFYLTSPEGTFYTEDSRNGGDANVLVFRGEGGGQDIDIGGTDYALGLFDWILAFEDRPLGVTDKDYNDFVFLAHGFSATPEPATLALLGFGALVVGRRAARRRAKANVSA
jgi:hypothetical protein